MDKNRLIHALYTIPMVKIIKNLSRDKKIKDRIHKINNPYWIIKDLYESNKKELEKALS